MFTTFFSFSLLLALARFVLAQSDFMIDTPSFVQCQAANITWTDTSHPPYDILIVSANDQCGSALEDLGNWTSTALTWDVNIPAGTQVVLSAMDAAGGEAWSGTITIGASNNNSCLTNNSPSTPPSGTTLSIPPSSSTTNLAPAGAAGAGIMHTSGAPSTCHLCAATLLGSAVLAVVASAL